VESKRMRNFYEDSHLLLFQAINFDSPRGGISLVTEKGPVTSSRLLIQKATDTDNGLYICDPVGAKAAKVRVHILNGKSIPMEILLSDLPACLWSKYSGNVACRKFSML